MRKDIRERLREGVLEGVGQTVSQVNERGAEGVAAAGGHDPRLGIGDERADAPLQEVLAVVEVGVGRGRLQRALHLQQVAVIVVGVRSGAHENPAGLRLPTVFDQPLADGEAVQDVRPAVVGLGVDEGAEAEAGAVVKAGDAGRGVGRTRGVIAPGGAYDERGPDGGEGAPWDTWSRERIAPLYDFEIPYRTLVPLKIENLLVAGRSISGTQEADSWFRDQHCVMTIGQGAGVAAALASKHGIAPRQVNVAELRARIAAQGITTGGIEAAPTPPVAG